MFHIIQRFVFLFLCWTTFTHGGDKPGLKQDKKNGKGQYLERSEPEELVLVGVELRGTGFQVFMSVRKNTGEQMCVCACVCSAQQHQ